MLLEPTGREDFREVALRDSPHEKLKATTFLP